MEGTRVDRIVKGIRGVTAVDAEQARGATTLVGERPPWPTQRRLVCSGGSMETRRIKFKVYESTK